MRTSTPWTVASFVAAAILGLGSVILPVYLLALPSYSAPLFPMIRAGIEGLSRLTFVFLFVSGLLLGGWGKGPSFLLGLATMAPFPILATLEMLVSPASHNLWPLEFAMYGFVSLVAVIGIKLGRFIRKKVRRRDGS